GKWTSSSVGVRYASHGTGVNCPNMVQCKLSERLHMVPLTALWLPILLSAIIVFVASSIMHMLLPYHRSDYQRLPDEDKLLVALRSAGLNRGLYIFLFCTHNVFK